MNLNLFVGVFMYVIAKAEIALAIRLVRKHCYCIY